MSEMTIRPRRLRRSPLLRETAAETRVDAARLMMPHFVIPGEGASVPVNLPPPDPMCTTSPPWMPESAATSRAVWPEADAATLRRTNDNTVFTVATPH